MTGRDDNRRIPYWAVGLIALVLTVFAFYLGFAKRLPFVQPRGYEVSAVFQNAQNIRVKSPVRVAGVNVGEVTEVKHLVTDGEGQQAAVIKMEIKDSGRPIKEDATLQLRPRLFLEGNLFVDLKPGTPGAPELDDNGTIPIAQTSTSVQVDQVLTTLQQPVRENLQTFLIEFGDALDTYGGGEGLRDVFRSSGDAFRYTAEVNEATLGTQPGDLRGLIVNLDTLFQALDQNEGEIKDVVTNLADVLSAFGAEDQALEAAIFELPRVLGVGQPALVKLNRALPALRAFSREILPGVRTANSTLDAANPFIAQLRGLVGPEELRGLVDDLRPTVPSLANLTRLTIPFMEQARLLSSCFNQVVIPWSNMDIPSADGENVTNPATGDDAKVYEETGYGLVGIAGESRSGDANGQYIRVGAGGGTNTIATPPIPGEGTTVGQLVLPLLGAEPSIGSSAKTPFHPNTPCETQEPPDLRSGGPAVVPGQTAGDRDQAATLPDNLAPFAEAEGRIAMDILKGQQEGGKEGRQQQADAYSRLRDFYSDNLRAYRKALHTGSSPGVSD